MRKNVNPLTTGRFLERVTRGRDAVLAPDLVPGLRGPFGIGAVREQQLQLFHGAPGCIFLRINHAHTEPRRPLT